jgi:hypothetical protein
MEEGVDENNQQKENPAKQQKPPPIFVDGVCNISPLTQLLNEVAKNEHELKILNNQQVKIQPKTTEKFSIIVKALKEKQTSFHTYKPKEERNFKVVLKNMHPSTNT